MLEQLNRIMGSQKRKEGETFEDYRKRLKIEQGALDKYLKTGRMIWASSAIIVDKKTKTAKKYRLAGTYRSKNV